MEEKILVSDLPIDYNTYAKNAVKLFRQTGHWAHVEDVDLENIAAEIIIQGAISLTNTLTCIEDYDDQGPFHEDMTANFEGMEEANDPALYANVINTGTAVMYRLARDLKDKGIDEMALAHEIKCNGVAFKANLIIQESEE